MTMQNIINRLSMVLVLFFIFLVSGCVTAKQKKLDAGLKPLTDQELQAIFAKSFKASYRSYTKDITIYLEYFDDGRQKVETPKGEDEGTYRIVNGEQCSKWNNIRQGAEKCATWFKVTDNTYDIFERNGSYSGRMTVK